MQTRQKTITVYVASDDSEHLTVALCEQHEINLRERAANAVVDQMKARTEAQWKERVEAARQWNADHPEEAAAWMAERRAEHQMFMEHGLQMGWWAGLKPNGDPIPHPKIVKISELEEHEKLLAHIVHKLGFFESVSEAKKNGWNKPVAPGDHWLKKKTVHIRIVE